MDENELKNSEEIVESDNKVQELEDSKTENVDSNTVTENEVTTQNDVPSSKKSGDKKIFILLGIIIVALAALLFFAYKMYFSPKQMFLKSVNKGYAEFEEFIDDISKENKDNKKAVMVSQDLSVNVKVNDSLADENIQGILDELNKMQIKMQVGYDNNSKEMLINVDALYNSKDLINIGAYTKKEKMYMELKNLFDKYIEVPMEDYETYFEGNSVETEDIKYVLSKSKDAFINNLDKDSFKQENKTIKVNGKEIKATKISYGLSQKSANELAKLVLEDLKKDSKYIDALATVSGKDKDEIKDLLKESLDMINDNIKNGDLSTKEEIVISVYVKGITKKSVGYEISVEDAEEDGKYLLTYYKNGKAKEINIYQDDEVVINALVKDSKLVIKINDETTPGTITIAKKEEDKKVTYDYELEASGVSIKGSVISKAIKEEKDGSYEAETSVSAKIISSGMELGSITFKGKSSTEYKDKIELPDVSNSISYENLTEDDYNKIMSKLMENKELVSLIQKINSYANGMSSY